MSDELVLLDAQCAFILGQHQLALKTIQKLKSGSSDVELQANVLTYQVYIAQKKYGVVLDEIPEDAKEPELKLLRLLATYLSKGVSDNALTVQCLLHMNRCDLAGKAVRRMQTADEDSLAAQLAAALYYVKKGGDQLQESIHIYEELREKHGPSTLLLNGQAAALMGMNNWVEAEPVLQEAIDLDGNNPDTIVNMIVVYHHLGKPAEEDEFTRCAKHYAPSVPG
uniref:Coatomer subunit epsilon n=1 Tax=Schistosoma haematobium TaxID=6185 RepID=A0A095A321_SCHHA